MINKNNIKKNDNKGTAQEANKSFLKKPVGIITALGLLSIIVYIAFSLLTPKPKEADVEPKFRKDGVLIFQDSLSKPKFQIDVEMTRNEYDRQLGMMFRKSVPDNQGMLFSFGKEQELSFWMRNTFVSLDMMFVNAQRKIVTIRKNAIPLREDLYYRSTEPAMYVVEVRGGFADEHNIVVGDYISWQELSK